MICLIALVVFGVLGLFSATHRKIAAEAFDCVFRRVTLRPCTTGLDKKLKAKISMGLFKKNKRLGGFVHKNFELISWAFTALMVISLVFSALGVYNYVVYGNCNGPHSDEVCVFDFGGGISCESPHCETEGCDCGEGEEDCNAENNYAPCEGDCDCIKEVCG